MLEAANVILGLSRRSKKSKSEVEKAWKKAKEIVSDQFPDIKKGSERFFKIVTGVTKKIIGLKEKITTTSANVGAGQSGSFSPKVLGLSPEEEEEERKKREKRLKMLGIKPS